MNSQNRFSFFMHLFTDCGAAFMHLLDFNNHVKSAHSNRKMFNMKHFALYGFNLCQCPYCEHQTDTIEMMQDHLRDKHSTRFSYALIRMQGSVKPKINLSASNQKLASIIVFDFQAGAELAVSKLSNAQINFMNPALNSNQNQNDPPKELGEHQAIKHAKQAQFIQSYRTETTKWQKLESVNGIYKVSELLKGSRVESSALDVQHVQSPAKEVPIFRMPAQSMAAAAAATSSSPGPSMKMECNSGNNNSKLNSSDDRGLDAALQIEIDASAKLIIENNGIVDANELFHCAFENCEWVKSCEKEFLAHLSQHLLTNFKCYHCNRCFTMAVDLKEHIKSHQKCRIFCYYCDFMSPTQFEMEKHFNTIHGTTSNSLLPLNSNNYDLSTDLFVMCPVGKSLSTFNTQLMTRASKLKSNKRKFKPTEIDKLPTRQVFQEELECELCGYKNKVRSNLIRHFKTGCDAQQQTQAPVNPVNNSTERHFDKMRNLAASSNSDQINSSTGGGMSTASAKENDLGKFVPESELYRCFSRSCKTYKTVSLELLQQHIEACHASETEFICPHCGTDTSACTTKKEMVEHLHYHAARIFKCPNCEFIHYTKTLVDKHIIKTHPNVRERAITLDRPAKKEEPPKVIALKSGPCLWSCKHCSQSFDTRPMVKTHLQTEHRLSGQHKCTICQYSHELKSVVKDHLMKEHGDTDVTKINCNYERIELDADNRPLWRRDPSRVSLDNFFCIHFCLFYSRIVFCVFFYSLRLYLSLSCA